MAPDAAADDSADAAAAAAAYAADAAAAAAAAARNEMRWRILEHGMELIKAGHVNEELK